MAHGTLKSEWMVPFKDGRMLSWDGWGSDEAQRLPAETVWRW